jgi:conserved hypothetical protein (putative transposase or invertase)
MTERSEISARSDLLFKKVFSSPEHKEIPIGLIKDLLKIEVVDITIENPYSIKNYATADGKQKVRSTAVDVLIRTADNQNILIEMQRLSHDFFPERTLFYSFENFTKNYARFTSESFERKQRNHYGSLNAMHSLIIVDFKLWNDNVAFRTFKLRDENNNEYQTSQKDTLFSISFLELPKEAPLEQAEIRQWQSYFLDKELDISVPKYIRYARNIININNLDGGELEMLSREEKNEADYYAVLSTVERLGEERGREEGREEGLEQGVIATAKKMLIKGFSITDISEITGLSQEEIKRLK